jgi:hypothetical protein
MWAGPPEEDQCRIPVPVPVRASTLVVSARPPALHACLVSGAEARSTYRRPPLHSAAHARTGTVLPYVVAWSANVRRTCPGDRDSRQIDDHCSQLDQDEPAACPGFRIRAVPRCAPRQCRPWASRADKPVGLSSGMLWPPSTTPPHCTKTCP